MAGVLVDVNSGDVSLTVDTLLTVLQIVAPTNQRLKVKRWKVTFKSISNTDTPVLVRMLRQTTAGTMSSGVAGTHISKRNNADTETVQTTVQYNASAEPTAGNVLDRLRPHPQYGCGEAFESGEEIIIPGGGRLGFELTAHEAQTAVVSAVVEE